MTRLSPTSTVILSYCRSELDRLVPQGRAWPSWPAEERDLITTLMAAMYADGVTACANAISDHFTAREVEVQVDTENSNAP